MLLQSLVAAAAAEILDMISAHIFLRVSVLKVTQFTQIIETAKARAFLLITRLTLNPD